MVLEKGRPMRTLENAGLFYSKYKVKVANGGQSCIICFFHHTQSLKEVLFTYVFIQ